MVLGWRKVFCTSVPKDRDPGDSTPRSSNRKFSFFSSNPSTPRLQTHTSPNLRCRTIAEAMAEAATAPSSLPASPKLQCKTKNSPLFFHRSSTPSSPRSPSTFSLLKSSLGLSKSRCGICTHSMKRGQGMAIFTAECAHTFHFPCIAEHVKRKGSLACPVCRTLWKEMPVLSVDNMSPRDLKQVHTAEQKREKVATRSDFERKQLRPDLKVYNDDEPLIFNSIPETDESCEVEDVEFQGFFVNGSVGRSPVRPNCGNVEIKLLPEAAVVSVGKSYQTCAVVLKVKAPVAPARSERRTTRLPIDLVIVLDVSSNMSNEKVQLMKRAVSSLVSSLSSSDRLSIVVFSATSKRLLLLKRMTPTGRRSARRIIDALVVLKGTSSAGDAVKKAAKVLEDRRERNPAASIIVLSDENKRNLHSSFASSTRPLEIPVHWLGFHDGACANALSKTVGGLLSFAVQDLQLQLNFLAGEIAAVYSHPSAGRPVALGSGTVRVGNLYAEQEMEFLMELRFCNPISETGSHQLLLSVRYCHRDSVSQEIIYGKEQILAVPSPVTVRSSSVSIQRLRNLFITTRALAESRRLSERNDLTGAYHMVVSARALLLQPDSGSSNEFVLWLEAELAEVQRRRRDQSQVATPVAQSPRGRSRLATESNYVDEKGEPLTPTSAWRVAEKLAKVAMMRKSVNRVSDLHGFEDARF